jgi:glycosyltransferase involved in cell wall biosynthesis
MDKAVEAMRVKQCTGSRVGTDSPTLADYAHQPEAPGNEGRAAPSGAASPAADGELSSASEGLCVSVIIPVHAGGEAFRRCLEGVASLSPAPCEVIVVDDGSCDGSGCQAAARGFCVLTNPEARGPAFARNLAAARAKGDILLFIDSDVVVSPDAIARVRDAFAGDSDLDALLGSYDDAPAAPGFLSQYRNLLHHYVHQTSSEDASTFWGACGAIRRKVFLAAGGFDQTYLQPSIEDIELGCRLKAAGHRIMLLKSLQVKHLKAWTLSSLLATDFFRRALPWTDLILRRRGRANDLNLKASYRASVVLVYVLVASLAAGLIQPLLLLVSAFAACGLLALNAPVYAFFARKRGLLFALAAIPLHWLYYLYCGLAFAIGLVRYLFGPRGDLTALPSRARHGAVAESDGEETA